MADYVLRVLTPEQADQRYPALSEGRTAIGPVDPALETPYLWIDTSVPGKFTFWIEDGN